MSVALVRTGYKRTCPQVLMGDLGSGSGDASPEHVGYCPQVNPLWPRMTLHEHLELYAAVKGLKGRDVPGIIQRWVPSPRRPCRPPGEVFGLSRSSKCKRCSCHVFFFVCFLCSVVTALELKEHVHKQAKSLTAGLKRKVGEHNSLITPPPEKRWF